MIIKKLKKSRIFMLNWIFVLSIVMAGMCLTVSAIAQQTKSIPAGEKTKLKGRIAQRDVDTLTIKESTGAVTVVLLNDATSVKSKGKGLGIFRRGEEYAVTSLIRGLVVEVEGVGNEKGQLVADKVRFSESDLKTTLTVDSRVTPVEESQKKLSGQVAEVGAVATEAKSEAAKANARISGLDNFDEKCNAEKNIALSQRRADTVVKYLAINGKVPMRRIVTPIGYGATRSAAERNTPEGLKLERRVEVKLLISRGQNQ